MSGNAVADGQVADWIQGGEGLVYARCRACGHVQYFLRSFCPACGAEALEIRAASGRGTVYAITRVVRAPSPEWAAYAPYGIALVDAPEGFRFMAHAAEGLAIGDRVATAFRSFGAALVPFVEPEK
jgi:uncharacterized OB-fold protein